MYEEGIEAYTGVSHGVVSLEANGGARSNCSSTGLTSSGRLVALHLRACYVGDLQRLLSNIALRHNGTLTGPLERLLSVKRTYCHSAVVVPLTIN